MPLTASKLRENIYRILDRVLSTGEPVDIERRGRLLRIIPVKEDVGTKLERIRPNPEALTGDPEDVVHLDWSGEWRP